MISKSVKDSSKSYS